MAMTFCLLIPLISGVLSLAFRNHLHIQRGISLSGMVFGLMNVTWLLLNHLEGQVSTLSPGNWPVPFGISLAIDLFSALFLVATNFIALVVLIYATKQLNAFEQRCFFFPLSQFLILGVNGALLTADLFNLYVWFEVMLLSSFVLLVLGRKKSQMAGGLVYVTLNLISSLIFLSAIGLLYGKIGTLNFADMAQKLAAHPDRFLVQGSAILLLVSFATKSALFPFFFWLPAAYHTPSVSITALFAGLLTKVGVYAIARTFTLIFPLEGNLIHTLLIWMAGLTMVLGVLGAAAQFEIKRILSFHIISQIGYMIMGLTFLTPLGIGAMLYFLFHNMIAKTNLFLISGWIEHSIGTTHLRETGGLFRSQPLLSFLFFTSALALAGIPPLTGFWGKLALIQAGFEVEAYGLVGTSLAVGVLTLFSMTKIWAEAFWKSPPQDAPKPKTAVPWGIKGPVIAFSFGLLVMSVWAGPLLNVMSEAGAALLSPTAYVSALMTGVTGSTP
jgi:multicomponent Na+:H+ antiporter subunit D